MHLPEELLDEVFGYLHEASLRTCSLVAKPWVYPAQRRLFSSVIITPYNYQSWKGNISPANAKLLRHVRSLQQGWFCRSPEAFEIDDPLADYYSSFSQLQSMILSGVSIGPDISKWVRMFSTFRHTLSSLALQIHLSWNTFVILVNYFPNLRDLKTGFHFWLDSGGRPPPLSKSLRGRPRSTTSTMGDRPIFSDLLSGLEMEYGGASYSQLVIDACANGIRRLSLNSCECFLQFVQFSAVDIS